MMQKSYNKNETNTLSMPVTDISATKNTLTMYLENDVAITASAVYGNTSKRIRLLSDRVKKIVFTKEVTCVLKDHGQIIVRPNEFYKLRCTSSSTSLTELLSMIPGDFEDIVSDGSDSFAFLRKNGRALVWSSRLLTVACMSNVESLVGIAKHLFVIHTDRTMVIFKHGRRIYSLDDHPIATENVRSVHGYGNNQTFVIHYMDGTIRVCDLKYCSEIDPNIYLHTLRSVVQVIVNLHGCAVLLSDGSVWSWHETGHAYTLRRNVKTIVSTESVFAALNEQGIVDTWGPSGSGAMILGESLNNVKEILATTKSFAAIKKDGTIFMWGAISPDILPKDVIKMVCTDTGFLVLTKQHTIASIDENGLQPVVMNSKSGTFFELSDSANTVYFLEDGGALFVDDNESERYISFQEPTFEDFNRKPILNVEVMKSFFAVSYRDGFVKHVAVHNVVEANLGKILRHFDNVLCYSVIARENCVLGCTDGTVKLLSWDMSRQHVIKGAGKYVAKKIVATTSSFAILIDNCNLMLVSADLDRSKSATVKNVADVFATKDHVIALLKNGSIRMWFADIKEIHANRYGFSFANVRDVHTLYSQDKFVIVYQDGSLATFGYGPKHNNPNHKLRNVRGVSTVCIDLPEGVFVLYEDGHVVSWSQEGRFGRSQVRNVVSLVCTKSSCAALRGDGTVVMLSKSVPSVPVPKGLKSVKELYSNHILFAALTHYRELYIWGEEVIQDVPALLQNVERVLHTDYTLIVLFQNGTMACFGNVIQSSCVIGIGETLYVNNQPLFFGEQGKLMIYRADEGRHLHYDTVSYDSDDEINSEDFSEEYSDSDNDSDGISEDDRDQYLQSRYAMMLLEHLRMENQYRL